MTTLSIAVSCHSPHWHETEDAFRTTMAARVADAQCALLVLPEYAAAEAALIGEPVASDDPTFWAARAVAAHDLWFETMRELACAQQCHILSGTGLVSAAGSLINRATLISPDGGHAHQDKMIPTPWERRALSLVGGDHLRLFETDLGKIGVAICYDAEFPAFSRALAAAGADVILVPACTDTQAGQDRVQIAARARALENQCLVVHAPLRGDVPGCDLIDVNIGRAGFFGPPDQRQPDGGIHVLAHPDTDAWCRAVPDLAPILASRDQGDAALFNDWPAQNLPDLPVDNVVLGK